VGPGLHVGDSTAESSTAEDPPGLAEQLCHTGLINSGQARPAVVNANLQISHVLELSFSVMCDQRDATGSKPDKERS